MKSNSGPISLAGREDPCFKDVSQRVMKAGYNEAQRPLENNEEKRVGSHEVQDNMELQTMMEMQADGSL